MNKLQPPSTAACIRKTSWLEINDLHQDKSICRRWTLLSWPGGWSLKSDRLEWGEETRVKRCHILKYRLARGNGTALKWNKPQKMFNSSLTVPTQNFRFLMLTVGSEAHLHHHFHQLLWGNSKAQPGQPKGSKSLHCILGLFWPKDLRREASRKTSWTETLTSFLQKSISSALGPSLLSALLSLSLRMRRSRPKEETDFTRISDLYPRLMIISEGWNID